MEYTLCCKIDTKKVNTTEYDGWIAMDRATWDSARGATKRAAVLALLYKLAKRLVENDPDLDIVRKSDV